MKATSIILSRYNPKSYSPEPVTAFDKDPVARKTLEATTKVVDYFKTTYGRDSWDGRGAEVRVVVGVEENNAYWRNENKTLYFGDGDGVMFSPLGTAVDVVAHEFMHAVIDSEVKLDYDGESGGIHESFSDILATGLDGNLQIGETVFTPGIKGDAIRALDHLSYTHVSQLPKPNELYYNEPHLWSEPLSHAAFLASREIGLDKVRNVWYTAVNEHLKDNAGFLGARQATISAAKSMYGETEVAALSQAWDAVGILDAPSKA